MEIDEPVTFAALLRRYRTAVGLSQEALAERAGLSRRGIADLERGARLQPHPETILRLANALGLGEDARGMLAHVVTAGTLRGRNSGPSSPAGAHSAESQSESTTASGRAHNLPAHLPSLIGREQALAETRQQLLSAPAGILTLTGAGGSGKTRLAVALATALVDQFADGVWLVELASLSDGGLIANAIAQAAGIQERPGRSIGGAICDAFSQRSTLLVLDNCEHVADGCAAVVSELLRACPHLCILATSRQSLHVSGEVVYRVPTLAAPELPRLSANRSIATSLTVDPLSFASVQLFLERAQAVQPDFALTAENSHSVARICARLDGLPLAIELAAAWVRVLSAGQILERLDDIFGLLVDGKPAAPTRQQTMHATLEWSFRQLGEHERQLFISLAAFAGGFDLDALGAVASAGEGGVANLLHVLNALVDKSLVQASHVGDAVRFRLLEPVRQFVDMHLVESRDGNAARKRHALYFVAFAERVAPLLLGPGGPAWLDRLDQEHDNLRVALEYLIATEDALSAQRLAGKLGPFWFHRCYWTEGSSFLSRVLSMHGGDAATVARANSLLWLSQFTEVKGEFAAARQLFLDTSRLQRELGDDVGLARSLVRLGHLSIYGDPTFARQALEEALSLTHATGQRATRVSALHGLARVNRAMGNNREARSLAEAALSLAKELQWTFGIAQAQMSLGTALGQLGDRAGARLAFEQSLHGYRSVRDSGSLAISLQYLGTLAVADCDYARAQACLAEALALRRELGDPDGIAWCLLRFAGLRAAQGHPQIAFQLWAAALAVRDKNSIGAFLPSESNEVEGWLAPARQALSEPEAENARKAGQRLTMDEATSLALTPAVGPSTAYEDDQLATLRSAPESAGSRCR